MKTQKYIYWQDETMFIGYLEAYPDYWTQGETIEALAENLLDIYKEIFYDLEITLVRRASGC